MLKEHKQAILFLVTYLLIYVTLNTIYAFYIQRFHPGPDPVTIMVTKHSASVMSLFEKTIDYRVVPSQPNVPLTRGSKTIVEVFEGCNSVNVMIVFVAFIFAFRGPARLAVQFLLGGIAIIYVANILRVIGLFLIADYRPEHLYFFHKFFFTGLLYLIVFVIWYFWVSQIKKWRIRTPPPSSPG